MRRIVAPLVLPAVMLAGCGKEPEAAKPPATVAHAVTEDQLTSVTLSADAARRLAIAVEPVDSASIAPSRTLGGEVVIPPGQSTIVAAPVAGTILAPEGSALPRAGTRVAERQPLLRLLALPPDRDMSRVEGDLRVAEAQLQRARAEFERLKPLHADRLIPARQFEQAQADLVSAEAAYEAAAAQRELVGKAATGRLGGLTALLITAPEAGVVRNLSVAPGQTVAAGTPLAEILRTDRLWVRVPIYAGDIARFDPTAEARVHGLGGAGSEPVLRAAPVAAPPSADPTAASVDLHYELRDGTLSLRPGQRVGVTLPLRGVAERALAVPLAALVRDMNGGSWVYVRTDSVTFTRRRVEVARVTDDRAVLSLGPEPGTPVVVAGAAELFGTEFGAGH